jgi:hypothetical protein
MRHQRWFPTRTLSAVNTLFGNLKFSTLVTIDGLGGTVLPSRPSRRRIVNGCDLVQDPINSRNFLISDDLKPAE